MEVTLKHVRPVLTVNVGDDVYRVPLTFNRAEYEALGAAEDKVDATNDFFAKYLGDVFDELGDDDVAVLLNAWTEARKELGMPEMGEPSASPSS